MDRDTDYDQSHRSTIRAPDSTMKPSKSNANITDIQGSTSIAAKKSVEIRRKKHPSPQVSPSLSIEISDHENLEDDLLPPAPHTPSRFKPSAILGVPTFELPISPSKSKTTTGELPHSQSKSKPITRKPVSVQVVNSSGTNISVPRSSSTSISRKAVAPIDMSVLANEVTAPITSASSFLTTTTRASQLSSRETSDIATVGALSGVSLLGESTQIPEQTSTFSTTPDGIERARQMPRNFVPKSAEEKEHFVECLVAIIGKLQATIAILEAHAVDWENFDIKPFVPFGTPLDAFIENRAPAELMQHVRKIVTDVQTEFPLKQANEADTSTSLSKTQKKNEKKKVKKQLEQQLAEDMKLGKDEAVIHAEEHAQEHLDRAMEQLRELDYAKYKVSLSRIPQLYPYQ